MTQEKQQPVRLHQGPSHCVDLHLRDKLAHFHLDDGVLQVHLQQLGIHRRTLTAFRAVGGEDPQHAHVAAHHQLVCKEATTAKVIISTSLNVLIP